MLVNISSATLRKMVKLSDRKEELLFQIQELDRQMAALQQAAEEDDDFIRPKATKRASPTKKPAPKKASRKSGPRERSDS